MAVIVEHRYSEAIHPFHAVLLAGTIPLFLGALICDITYGRTFHIQWSNFASWLLVGGMIFTSLALIFAIVDLARAHRRARGIGLYTLLLVATWICGLLAAFWHARDAWAMMPGGLILSAITTVLACVATWLGFNARRVRRTTV